MKFSEEYKSAMNEITPDEKTAERIERAVFDKIDEKTAKNAKNPRKKPIFIGTAISGAAVCAAVACIVIFRMNGISGGSLTNNIPATSKMTSQVIAETNENDEKNIVSSDFGVVDYDDKHYPAAEAPTSENLSGDCVQSAKVCDDGLEREIIFMLEYTENGGIIVNKDGFCEEFEKTGLVTRFNSPQKNLSSAISESGEKRYILIVGNTLYLFDEDLQTARTFNIK